MKRVFETVAIVVALGACQASPPSAGPSVSGESHFLSACAATSECVAGLECLCGRCTLACADDADCEAVESGAVCPDEMTCGAGGRTCTREVTDAGFQEPCVAPRGRRVSSGRRGCVSRHTARPRAAVSNPGR
jgi:hypothetical protein